MIEQETPQLSLRELANDEPQRHDLFIGLVTPLGSSNSDVVTALSRNLTQNYRYDIERVHLAGLLDAENPGLPSKSEPGYFENRMNAGDLLRKAGGDDSALAALAIASVDAIRKARREDLQKAQIPVVFIFDSLKHPREAELLRAVFGSGFWLVSVVEDMAERVQNLASVLAAQKGNFGSEPEADALALIKRDEADPDAKHGQQVRRAFCMADYFLPVERGADWEANVQRMLEGMFGSPFLTPRPDEEAMRHARAAALRSSAVGRQVGAVVIPAAGAPYIVGTNEVPRPGGGQYWEGDRPDHRDFVSGVDPNPAYTDKVIRELMERLAGAAYFSEERNARGGASILEEATTAGPDGRSILDDTRARSLIEFTRCLHAEQAALVDAARTGTAVGGGKLYTTTFPCHECAKFIVGAGILEVQYIEPYPKSLVGELYRDLIETRPAVDPGERGKLVNGKVPFRPFVGFSPSRFDEVFTANARRIGPSLAAHVPSEACPIGRGWNEVGLRSRVDSVVVAVALIVKEMRSNESWATEVASEDEPGSAILSDIETDVRG